jgi:hypothetical protein
MKKENLTTETVLITPEMAEEWFCLSGGNRPINKSHVAFLANEMRTNWELNGEAIIFDLNERLVEGHHRLIASSENHISFRTLVVRGVSPGAKATINTGRSRSGADALAYTGKDYSNNTQLSTTAARLLDYDLGRMSTPGKVKHSNAAIVAKVEASPGLIDSVKAVHACRGIIAITRLAWLHYLLHREHPKEVEEFFSRLADGLGMTEKNSIYLLRTRFSNARMTRRNIDLNEAMALAVKAWNAFFRRKQVRALRWTDDQEDFPKIEGI